VFASWIEIVIDISELLCCCCLILLFFDLFTEGGNFMNPYQDLDEKYFWATAIAKRSMFDISGLWVPKFKISPTTKVVTYGSCFAQHIGKALEARGFSWLISERAPLKLSSELSNKYNYGVFSARTGNIYTVSLLRQWLGWADGSIMIPDEIWERDGRYFDPFRPNIEPNGFESRDELMMSRGVSIKSFTESILKSDVFVFTLGLTESWVNKVEDYEYPMCPGTVAGDFLPDRHGFVNQSFAFIRRTLIEVFEKLRAMNPAIKIILTVSPVPLTATMSGNHILVATMESKSVLRAVAAAMQKQFRYVDYFPSYEIISGTPFRGAFFESNQRNVNHVGVDFVMNSFFQCLRKKFPSIEISDGVSSLSNVDVSLNVDKHGKRSALKPRGDGKNARNSASDEIVCEEELLAAFSKQK